MERTIVLIKPDAVHRGLIGEIISRFEKKGLKLIGLKMLRADDSLLKEHYAHLANKPFFTRIKEYMKSSPIIAICLEGVDCVEVVRKMCGITKAREAEPGTIRGDLAMSIQCNLVHASDSQGKAHEEIDRFFRNHELFDYERKDQLIIYSVDEIGTPLSQA